MSGGGGQQSSGTTMNITQENRNPWSYATPALGQALNSAVDTFWKTGGTAGEPYLASKDPWLTYGEEAMLQKAGENRPGWAADHGFNNIQDVLAGGGLHSAQRNSLTNLDAVRQNLNPYASGQYIKENPYLNDALRKSMEDASGAANAQFSAAGRYGSGAHSGALGKELGGIQTQARLADYYKQQENQLAANNALQNVEQLRAGIGQQGVGNLYSGGKGLSEMYMASQLAPQTFQEIGNQRSQYAQNQLDLAREVPWRNVANLTNIASQIGSMGGTSSGMNVGYKNERTSGGGGGVLGSIMGGATTGLSFLRNMGGLSGLGALFTGSDVRLKEDIKPVGKTFDGQNIYSYRYKAGGPKVFGLMAQEVLQHKPHAVAQDPESGMLMVNYDEATS